MPEIDEPFTFGYGPRKKISTSGPTEGQFQTMLLSDIRDDLGKIIKLLEKLLDHGSIG